MDFFIKWYNANNGSSALRVPFDGWKEVFFFFFYLGRAGGSTEEELCSLRAHSSFKTHAGQFQERQLCDSAEVTHRGFKAGLSIRRGQRAARLVQAFRRGQWRIKSDTSCTPTQSITLMKNGLEVACTPRLRLCWFASTLWENNTPGKKTV